VHHAIGLCLEHTLVLDAKRLLGGCGKNRSQVEYSIRRLKPLLILLGFCGATGSRALSKPPRIEFFRSLLDALRFSARNLSAYLHPTWEKDSIGL
jgi:hypothetical protein